MPSSTIGYASARPNSAFTGETAAQQGTLDKIEGLGSKATMPPMEVHGGPEIAAFADPEGNLIGKEGSM